MVAGGLAHAVELPPTLIVDAHPLSGRHRAIKRALDIVIAAAFLVLTLPLLALAILAIRLDSPGPALFVQTRVGRGGRRFRLYKLRTMNADADEDHAAQMEYAHALILGTAEPHLGLYKLAEDPRVTRVGRLLRRLSIDELPQFFNVLRGDMTLVGPRPPLPREAALYDQQSWERLRVDPGITGLWQVSGRSRLGFREMVELDLWYWQNWSLRLELSILLRTPLVVLSRRGAV